MIFTMKNIIFGFFLIKAECSKYLTKPLGMQLLDARTNKLPQNISSFLLFAFHSYRNSRRSVPFSISRSDITLSDSAFVVRVNIGKNLNEKKKRVNGLGIFNRNLKPSSLWGWVS